MIATPQRCTGHCCEAFYLPYSPIELRETCTTKQDGVQIAAMVTYLGKLEADDPRLPAGQEHAAGGHFYTCKNYDRESKRCRIYPARPSMCSQYPYGGTCHYKGCTLQGACMDTEKKIGESMIEAKLVTLSKAIEEKAVEPPRRTLGDAPAYQLRDEELFAGTREAMIAASREIAAGRTDKAMFMLGTSIAGFDELSRRYEPKS